MTFMSSLSREAQGKDFRVIIANPGGYGLDIRDLERHLTEPRSLSGTIDVAAQRDDEQILLRVTVNRDDFSKDGDLFRFDGSVGEFLDFDGRLTENFVIVTLSIAPSPTQEGQTVGVLRMEDFEFRLPSAM